MKSLAAIAPLCSAGFGPFGKRPKKHDMTGFSA
jgi:hypothetical protein